jgi:hypothetical protein
MAEYYSLVARAVGALDPSAVEARREVYERARAALLSEVQKLVPAWDRSEIMAEQLLLELAIGAVEAERQSSRSAPRRLDAAIEEPRDAALDSEIAPEQERAAQTRLARRGSAHPVSEEPHSLTIEESDCVQRSRMTEIACASPPLDGDFQDSEPKRAPSRVVGRFCDGERPDLREALALWSQGYAAYLRT